MLDYGSCQHPLGYGATVLVWSLAGTLTGAAANFAQLFSCRMLLGVGEARPGWDSSQHRPPAIFTLLHGFAAHIVILGQELAVPFIQGAVE
jgi:hypothetical protein